MAEAKLPTVPAAQNVQVPAQPTIPTFTQEYKPMTSAEYLKFQEQLYFQQLGQIRPLTDAMLEMQQDYGPGFAQQRLEMEQQFGPEFANQLMSQLGIADPEFMPTYTALGERVQQGLEAGYELGPELTHEMEQQIRAAQTARGNWLGGAPTAAEVFGRGSASVALYNQRLGAAQNFLQGRQPTDMWGALGMASGYQAAPAVYPQVLGQTASATDVFGQLAQSRSAYNATAANAYGTYVGAQSANYATYTGGLINAASVNNQSAFDRYSAQFDQFLYKQSVNQGLYSQPSMGGGGGMGSGFMGAAMGGIGTGLATGIGAAAMGVGTTGAVTAGIGAAAGAAIAAICWVARKALPDRWQEFRRFLFTRAPAEFRRRYIYYGRRLAETLSDDQVSQIRKSMERCLQS